MPSPSGFMAFFHGRIPEPATHFGGSLVGQSNSGTAELADGLGIQPVSDSSSAPERLHHYAQFHMNITHVKNGESRAMQLY